jgi:hypothetical protein
MDQLSKRPVPSIHSHGNAPLQMADFSREPQDTRDFGRVILGGGYASVSAPANPPIARRR